MACLPKLSNLAIKKESTSNKGLVITTKQDVKKYMFLDDWCMFFSGKERYNENTDERRGTMP